MCSFRVYGCIAKTFHFKLPQTKKYRGVKSEDLGGNSPDVSNTINLYSPKTWSKRSRDDQWQIPRHGKKIVKKQFRLH